MKKAIITGEFEIMEIGNAAPVRRSKARERIEALKRAGVDTSCFFSLGDNTVMKAVDGALVEVSDDDPVFKSIGDGPYISHGQLFRRWVMAQMFRMLRACEDGSTNLTHEIQRHGYEYSWRMLRDELYAQERMHGNGDTECLAERRKWFNRAAAVAMAEHYMKMLKKHVETLTVKKCKGRPYVTVDGQHIFTDELPCRLYTPLGKALDKIRSAATPSALAQAVVSFDRKRKHLVYGTPVGNAFMQAYKGAGAYFTCKNLILFHDARFSGMSSCEASLAHLTSQNEVYSHNDAGWRLIGLMKKLISDSGISVEGKIREWR